MNISCDPRTSGREKNWGKSYFSSSCISRRPTIILEELCPDGVNLLHETNR